MKTIYKYKLPIEAEVTFSIPGGRNNCLLVAEQDGELGNQREQVKQLGNAVTPPVMEMLIERCVQSLM